MDEQRETAGEAVREPVRPAPETKEREFTEEELARERWLPVPEWRGYDVSDLGRTRSWRTRMRKAFYGNNGWGIGDTPILMQPRPRKNGRLYLMLMDGERRQTFQVHQLVLLAFVGPCPLGMEACHAPDPDPTNCRLSNLRWDTHLSNMRDRRDHRSNGDYGGVTKLTADDIPAIWERLLAGEPRRRIAADYGVHEGTIQSIRLQKAWAHITRTLGPVPRRERYTIEQLEEDERRYGSLHAAADALGWTLRVRYYRIDLLRRHRAMLASQSA